MRPSSRIDLAVFQLTPTRTRCDLVILANGRTEKIASGLLNPFLSHLKAARDQMAIGGYSIELKLDPGSDAAWFTKGTVERFVRFVSTPEILERVDTLESEILQIEEAIAMQTNKRGGIPGQAEEYLGKSVDNVEATKPVLNDNDDKAIVLYKPNSQSVEANGSPEQERNSKVDLLKVLETRRNLLQKEQGMAFACAAAAGFELDVMDRLISFSQCFGAARLMDACKKFLDLWKKRQESGQWLEIEAAGASLAQSDFMATNASDIALTDASNRHLSNPETNAEKSLMNHHVPAVQQEENLQGQYSNPIFPPWQFQSPPGVPPGYQPYPMAPMPHYHYYPANGPYLQQAFSPMQDQGSKIGRTSRHKRNSRHNKESTSESEASDKDSDGNYSDEFNSEKEAKIRRKKRGSSGKKKSGGVVIRNINYISSKVQNGSDGEAHSATGSGREDAEAKTGTSARYGNHLLDTNEASYDKDVDGGHWQAFQNYLLKDNEEEDAADKGMFSLEKVGKMKKHQKKADDPLAVGGGDVGQYEEDYVDIQRMNGSATYRGRTSADGMLISRMGDQKDSRGSLDGHLFVQSNHINGRTAYRRTDTDEFMVQGRDEISTFSPSDMPAEIRYKTVHRDLNVRSSNTNDDVHIVSLRSNSLEPEGTGRQALDIDSEFPSASQQINRASKKIQPNYEPDYMSLMPERETERGSSSYNPAFDYELHAQRLKESLQNMNEEAAAAKNQGPKKNSKDQKMKLTQDAARTTGTMRKGRPTKLSPLDEARARAERMRSYKADLQKVKKEKEEEQLKRLEGLKIDRQKRIAARSSCIPGQSSSQLDRKQLPSRPSPSSKPLKFTDTEPGSSSPLQRSSKRTVPMGPIESQITVKQSPGSRLSRSAPSLPEELRDSRSTKPDAKASMARIRRLSEPKMTSDGLVPSVKPQSMEANRRRMSSESDSKKISAIINLDKSKAATLPELKIRASIPSDGSHSNLAARKNPLTVSGNKQDKPINIAADVTHRGDVDDNSIVEKNVVMLKFEKPSVPQPCTSQDKDHFLKKHPDGHISIEKPETFPKNVNWQSPNAPAIVESDTIKVPEHIHDLQTYNLEASPNTMKTNSTEKQYQAPYAHISPLEDPCTENSEYFKAPPACLVSRTEGLETVKVRISDLHEVQMQSLPETVEKQSKESSAKGFKRLLKFGRKSSNSESSERFGELDNVSVDESKMDGHASYPGPSNEAYTLKNLISQVETPTDATTPKKSSRSFSLLSPFRSKSGKKKNAA